MTLLLETPLRLKREEHVVTPETFGFGALFATLLRRISLLTAFHTDTPLETDFAGLTRAGATDRTAESGTALAGVDPLFQSAGNAAANGRTAGRDRPERAGAGTVLAVSLAGPVDPTSMGLGRYRVVVE